MKTLLLRWKIMKEFAAVVRDPSNTEAVFRLSAAARKVKGPLEEEIVGFLRKQPVWDLYQEGYTGPNTLEVFPPGTLGHALAEHLRKNQLRFDFYPQTKRDTFVNYLEERARKSHDSWHVLTGFDTSVPGEVGLQAFTLAQMRSPFSATLIAAGILHSVSHRPDTFWETIECISRGLQLGKKAKPLIGLKLEEMWGRSLEELRRDFGLVA
jgi:ubiquinone biosynthesis protein COQ4